MNKNINGVKKLPLMIVAAVAFSLMGTTAKAANPTSSGSLTVTATVTSSIGLIFNTGASGVPLTGTGSNAATLAFGSVSAYGTPPANVTVTNTATSFTVSTPIAINVTKYNLTSPACTVTAQMGSPDPNNTFSVGGVTVTSASAVQVSNNLAYQPTTTGGVSEAVAVTVLYATNAPTISNTINFVATAN